MIRTYALLLAAAPTMPLALPTKRKNPGHPWVMEAGGAVNKMMVVFMETWSQRLTDQ